MSLIHNLQDRKIHVDMRWATAHSCRNKQ